MIISLSVLKSLMVGVHLFNYRIPTGPPVIGSLLISYTLFISSLILNILSLIKSYILYISSGSSFFGE
nr:MAG TPA: hypothetical protein [Caudoviricetes sp.]